MDKSFGSEKLVIETSTTETYPAELPMFKTEKKEVPTIPVSYKTLTVATCIPLIVLPVVLAKQGCERGDYACTLTDFPYVSKTLGVFPNDKTYIFMMQFFTAV